MKKVQLIEISVQVTSESFLWSTYSCGCGGCGSGRGGCSSGCSSCGTSSRDNSRYPSSLGSAQTITKKGNTQSAKREE